MDATLTLPHMALTMLDGQRKFLSDYRGYDNLVLIRGKDRTRALLNDLLRQRSAVIENDAQVLIIVDSSKAAHAIGTWEYPFSVLIDVRAKTREAIGVVCIADRFGEIYALYTLDQAAPRAPDVIACLNLIEIQCPE